MNLTVNQRLACMSCQLLCILDRSRGYYWRGSMVPFIAPIMKILSKEAFRASRALFSSTNRSILFSRCRMYLVALLSTYNSQSVTRGHGSVLSRRTYRSLAHVMGWCQVVQLLAILRRVLTSAAPRRDTQTRNTISKNSKFVVQLCPIPLSITL